MTPLLNWFKGRERRRERPDPSYHSYGYIIEHCALSQILGAIPDFVGDGGRVWLSKAEYNPAVMQRELTLSIKYKGLALEEKLSLPEEDPLRLPILQQSAIHKLLVLA